MVDVGVVCGVTAVQAALLTEVHAASELTYAQEIRTVHQFLLQGTLVDQGREGLYGTEVGVEPELLAHRKQALLGPHLRGGVVVIPGVSHGAVQHSVALHAYLVRLLRIGRAIFVYGAGPGLGETVFNFVSETGADGVHGLLRLVDHFRSDAVTRHLSNLQSHFMVVKSKFSMMLSILTVALMAASVWSESMPRVLNSWPSMSQTMVVATRASVFPPGGMLTI